MSEFNCPHCGRLLVARIEIQKHDTSYGVPWKPTRPMTDSARRLGDAVQPTTPEFSEAYRDTPARAPSVEADWSVPTRRALTTGILFGPVIGGTVGMLTPNVNFGNDLLWGVIITGGTIAASWILFLSTSDSTLWIREKIINKDLDKDDQGSESPSLRVEYEDHEDGRDREVWADLPLPRKRGYAGLISLARGIVSQGESFSERIAADYSYTRQEWNDLRDVFLSNGWAVWNHPDEERQGVTLLSSGKSVLRRIAREGVPREEWLANE